MHGTLASVLRLGGVAALSALCVVGSGPAGARDKDIDEFDPDPLVLRDQGSFFVNGKTLTRDFEQGFGDIQQGEESHVTVNQMYVQFQIPRKLEHRYPVVMLHGCCLTGKTYEDTPDGRIGWAEYFVRKGHAVYVPDQVGRGRSGFNATPFIEAKAGLRQLEDVPNITHVSYERAWEIFRFGPRFDERFPGQQFPDGAFDELFKQMVPDLSAWVPTPNPTWANLAILADRLDGAILMGHSQSGFFPQRAALSREAERNDDEIKGLISLEPGSCSADTLTGEEIEDLAEIPQIVVFGDFIEEDTSGIWANALIDCQRYAARINDAGGDATVLELPDAGLQGNTHMFMQDRNSIAVADVLRDWIKKHVERK